MRALDAKVETVQSDGAERVIPIAEFHHLPGDTPHVETALEMSGELITAVPLPDAGRREADLPQGAGSGVLCFCARFRGLDVDPNGTGRVALGFVAPKPWRDEAANAELPRGPKPVMAKLFAHAKPTQENAFKIQLAERTLGAVLADARAEP